MSSLLLPSVSQNSLQRSIQSLCIFSSSFFFLSVFFFAVSAECCSFLASNDNGMTLEVVAANDGPLSVLNSTVYAFDKNNLETKRVSHPDRTVITIPLLGINNFDQAVVVWQSLDAVHSIYSVEVAGYVEGKGWSPPKVVSSNFEEIEPASARFHFSQNGHISVFWNIIGDSKRLRREHVIFDIGDLFDSEAEL